MINTGQAEDFDAQKLRFQFDHDWRQCGLHGTINND
jgi:hypothetical protein